MELPRNRTTFDMPGRSTFVVQRSASTLSPSSNVASSTSTADERRTLCSAFRAPWEMSIAVYDSWMPRERSARRNGIVFVPSPSATSGASRDGFASGPDLHQSRSGSPRPGSPAWSAGRRSPVRASAGCGPPSASDSTPSFPLSSCT
ncbi:hypothetical protein PBRA_006260 [Plasmodiophora brassicae]|uniref:Uncharacterized protein n=1 Tax=Plasmodiophora brassicae TaxID=37360 RepID=A0A0G4ISS5_PLABS|nr:hypothetical protein PBRA_006260 [Plasmodiophora brassicae]